MADQIIINIVGTEVGIEYRAESPEAEIGDRLAAAELALHALARHVRDLEQMAGRECPRVVADLVASDLWKRGL